MAYQDVETIYVPSYDKRNLRDFTVKELTMELWSRQAIISEIRVATDSTPRASRFVFPWDEYIPSGEPVLIDEI